MTAISIKDSRSEFISKLNNCINRVLNSGEFNINDLNRISRKQTSIWGKICISFYGTFLYSGSMKLYNTWKRNNGMFNLDNIDVLDSKSCLKIF